jgi:hypothetical protein
MLGVPYLDVCDPLVPLPPDDDDQPEHKKKPSTNMRGALRPPCCVSRLGK